MSTATVEANQVTSATVDVKGFVSALTRTLPTALDVDTFLPGLRTIRFVGSGTTLMVYATNRYDVVFYTVDMPDPVADFAVTVPADTVKAWLPIVKAQKTGMVTFTVDGERGQVELVTDGGTMSGATYTNGEYPRLSSVVTGAVEGARKTGTVSPVAALSPASVARLSKGMVKNARLVYFRGESDQKPVVVTDSDDARFLALSMPIRSDGAELSAARAVTLGHLDMIR